jgi:TonB family protein
LSFVTFSQSDSIKIQPDSIKTDKIICFSPSMPSFTGGVNSMNQFINENFHYPEKASENREQGTIWVEFIINEKGEVINVKVIKGVSDLLDKEALRVIQSMPNWIPGITKGKPTRIRYSISIKAKLT